MRQARALVLAIFLVLAGCAAPQQNNGPVTLTMWVRSGQDFVQQVVDGFNRTHPDIHVRLTVVPDANFVQKLGVAVAGNAGPDLASIDVVFVPLFASSGVLADITGQAHQLPYLDLLSAPHQEVAQYQGHTYALPFSGDASVLYYNTDLFRRAGLDPNRPPRTWQEMYDDAAKIRALGPDTYGYFFSGASGGSNIFTFTPLIWATGGDVLSGPVGNQHPTVATDPTVLDALGFYHQMWANGLIDPQSASDDASSSVNIFGSGRIGMYSNGSFVVDTLHKDYPNLHFRAAPIPGRNGGSSSFTGGDDIAITNNSKHRDAAWQFMTWATSASAQQQYFGGQGVVPIRRDVAFGPYSSKGPDYALLAQSLFSGKVVDTVQENALINSDTSPWLAMISKATLHGNVPQAADQAQADMANILARG